MNLSDGRSLSVAKKNIKKNERSVREIIVAQVPVSRKNIFRMSIMNSAIKFSKPFYCYFPVLIMMALHTG